MLTLVKSAKVSGLPQRPSLTIPANTAKTSRTHNGANHERPSPRASKNKPSAAYSPTPVETRVSSARPAHNAIQHNVAKSKRFAAVKPRTARKTKAEAKKKAQLMGS